MNTHKNIAHAESAQQVLRLFAEGKSISAACQDVGIPRSTYYDYLKRHPEIVAQNKEAVRLVQAQTLGMILLHQRQIMEKILEEALADRTSTRDRLAIMKYLDQREKELFEMGAGKNKDDDPAALLIQREITLKRAESKMYQKREE